jgi:hypothetical protein
MGNTKTCSVDGCDNKHYGHGYCNKHYQKWKTYGDPLVDKTKYRGQCSVKDCNSPHYGNGLCSKHNARLTRHGSVSINLRPKVGICHNKNCSAKAETHGYCADHYIKMRTAGKMVCAIDGCNKKIFARGWCSAHYSLWREHGTPERQRIVNTVCTVDGCGKKATAKHMCNMHYHRWKNHGDALYEPSTPAETVDQIKWLAPGEQGYVYGTFKNKRVSQHRVVWEQRHGRALHPFENIHHINGIRHDNRIENLELWTKPQPTGQRPEDLVAWVVENYPDMIAKQMKGKTNDQPASPRRQRSGNGNNKRPASRPDASRRTSRRAVRSR